MERHRCKLCLKNFTNGRALSGHMRSHGLNLYVPSNTEQLTESPPLEGNVTDFDSLSSSSSEEEYDDGDDDKGLFGYGLKESPKKSLQLSDFQVSHVVQDGEESEAESSKNPKVVGRRSKRVRKSGNFKHGELLKKKKLAQLRSHTTELTTWVDPEPVSSISNTTPEEDVAYTLMMLSRDKWGKEKDLAYYDDYVENSEDQEQGEYYYEDYEKDESDHEVKVISKASGSKGKGKYRCDTCNKVFKSYQALGGHRASHKKMIRLNSINHNQERNSSVIQNESKEAVIVEEKIHECPVCFRVFASGQALGGHKRSHVIGVSIANNAGLVHAKPVVKQREMGLIDLNMPAPIEEEEEISQVEVSAISDGEFVKIH